MALLDFLTYGLDPMLKTFLYENLPLYLLVFATIFICLMVLIIQVAPGNPALGIAAVIFSMAGAWIIVRDMGTWRNVFSSLAGAWLTPLLMVLGVVVFVLVILDMLS